MIVPEADGVKLNRAPLAEALQWVGGGGGQRQKRGGRELEMGCEDEERREGGRLGVTSQNLYVRHVKRT